MASKTGMRASDADRDRIATALRENLAAGRLSTDEFDERLDKALSAKTLGELDGVMTDLPGTELGPRADAQLDRAKANPPSRRAGYYPMRRTARGSLIAIGVLLLVIWLFSGVHASLALLWVAAALAVLILARRMNGRRYHAVPRADRPRHYHRHGDRRHGDRDEG